MFGSNLPNNTIGSCIATLITFVPWRTCKQLTDYLTALENSTLFMPPRDEAVVEILEYILFYSTKCFEMVQSPREVPATGESTDASPRVAATHAASDSSEVVLMEAPNRELFPDNQSRTY